MLFLDIRKSFLLVVLIPSLRNIGQFSQQWQQLNQLALLTYLATVPAEMLQLLKTMLLLPYALRRQICNYQNPKVF
ncbi:hypothetical protein RO3G_00235 [Rhizopus delemar RA 99-880]|uniref:Uncharacterized protein n=1 Tax=Rhizopus delemar (strain RA 99-880 / ATCC MYA-4621 / FGSC 9543 / NRRL 43880) TaxID=246409 RepID=I1BH51_RHIO9|nr:hypothetical protein RO3G_00235 [Rhizopus delemar RA 99-880]|eukprot:EIE75531.1 hypothetical protein RO3G_00235 [Rhizopus delemar RA 99-880]